MSNNSSTSLDRTSTAQNRDKTLRAKISDKSLAGFPQLPTKIAYANIDDEDGTDKSSKYKQLKRDLMGSKFIRTGEDFDFSLVQRQEFLQHLSRRDRH